jgi:ribosomal protein S27AE
MTQEIRVLSLQCPNCAASLEVADDMQDFSCGYCGSRQSVIRRGGTVSLKLIGDAIARVQTGTDKTAAELALARLSKELVDTRARMQQLDHQAALQILARKARAKPQLFWTLLGSLFVLVTVGNIASAAFGVVAAIITFAAIAIPLGHREEKDVAELLTGLQKQLEPFRASEASINAQIDRHKTFLNQ